MENSIPAAALQTEASFSTLAQRVERCYYDFFPKGEKPHPSIFDIAGTKNIPIDHEIACQLQIQKNQAFHLYDRIFKLDTSNIELPKPSALQI